MKQYMAQLAYLLTALGNEALKALAFGGQVWRPLVGPVDDSPLGMLDVASIDQDDYLSHTLYFPGRTGYNFTLAPDKFESHRYVASSSLCTRILLDVDRLSSYLFGPHDLSGMPRFS